MIIQGGMIAMDENNRYDINHHLDIRGRVCPMTYVYTKLKLEEMKSGEILEVILDFPGAIKNIPKSAKQQNLGDTVEIREIDSEKKMWVLLIKKI